LQDQFALGSIHGAGVMMFGLVTASCLKWPPAPSAFASRRKKSPVQSSFCKRLHEQRGVRAIYNKAEYAEQRRAMLQTWADMLDGWIRNGGNVVPIRQGVGIA